MGYFIILVILALCFKGLEKCEDITSGRAAERKRRNQMSEYRRNNGWHWDNKRWAEIQDEVRNEWYNHPDYYQRDFTKQNWEMAHEMNVRADREKLFNRTCLTAPGDKSYLY